ncbi:DMT family transporter [Halobacillus litoralis]|uniref:DMT family transporter n=1 Tax=Halobacillus litoralis TaxID=45668 RepID=UPI001CFC9150|nr:DMT family transporter [Halobacillus litoralis]
MKLYGALITLSLIWGLSFVFIETLIGPAGVWGTVFLRCSAGAAILIPLLIWKWQKGNRPAVIPWKSLFIVGLFNAGLPWGLIALSQTVLTSNTTAVLNALTPIMTGLIGSIAFSILLNKRQWGGIVLGFIGIIVITGFNMQEILSENFIGIGTMLLATSCYGFVSHYTKKHLQGFNVLLLTTAGLLVGAAVGGLGMVVTDPFAFERMMDADDIQMFLSVIGLGCIGSGMAHLLYYYLIENGGPEFASMVTYLVPVTALFWGHVLLGEPVTTNLIFGLMVIFAGVFLSTRRKKTKVNPVGEQVYRV